MTDTDKPGRAMAALRWKDHKHEPTSPRRLKVATIKRVKAYGAAWGLKFDDVILRLLDQSENTCCKCTENGRAGK